MSFFFLSSPNNIPLDGPQFVYPFTYWRAPWMFPRFGWLWLKLLYLLFMAPDNFGLLIIPHELSILENSAFYVDPKIHIQNFASSWHVLRIKPRRGCVRFHVLWKRPSKAVCVPRCENASLAQFILLQGSHDGDSVKGTVCREEYRGGAQVLYTWETWVSRLRAAIRGTAFHDGGRQPAKK